MKTQKIILAACIVVTAAGNVFADDARLADRVTELETKLAALEPDSENGLQGKWKNGLVFEDQDKSFSLKIGGRTQLDVAAFDADQFLEDHSGAFTDGTRFRRIRLYLSGTLYDNLLFKIEYDIASDILASTYIGVKEVPYVGNIRVGHQVEPFSLEENISNNYITFLERGSITAFSPVFNTGIKLNNTAADKRMTWAIGAFQDTDNKGKSMVSNEAWNISARITGLPYISDDEKTYVHIGASTSHRNFDNNSYSISARPHSRIAPKVVNTGKIMADVVDLTGIEAILTLDQLSLQAEYMQSSVDRITDADPETTDGDLEFDTYYIMASYFLTGEHRPYSKSSGAVTRVIPINNATGNRWGSGAWEIAARYDVIDLNDGDIEGGEMESYTFGLNWYLNPHSRVMFNYITSDVKDTGSVDIFTMRFAVDL